MGPPSARREIGAGLLTALGMLFHQTGVFFALAALPLLLTRERPLRSLVRFGLAAAVGCGLPYALVMAAQGVRSGRDALHWLFLYVDSPQFANGDWGGGGHLRSLPSALIGFGNALALPSYLERIGAPALALRPRELGGSVALALAAVALLVALVAAGRRPRPTAPSVTPALRATLTLWALSEALFAFWWVPWNFEFWLLALPPLVLLVGLVLARAADDVRVRRLVIAAAGLLVIGNFGTRIAADADSANNATLTVTRVLAAQHASADDLVLSNVPELAPYSSYFFGQPLTLDTIRAAPDARGLQQLRARIDAARHGHRVFVVESEMSEAHRCWSRDDVRRFYAELRAGATELVSYPDRGRRGALYQLR